jgi:hypothetical protein
MLKKISLVLLMVAAGIICNAEEAKNLIPNPNFADNFKGWYLTHTKVFSVKKNILSITGLPEAGKKNSYIKCAQSLKLSRDKVAGKKFTFGITVKVTKVSGKLMLAVREIDVNGKTITYQAIKLKKRDKYDWKKNTKTFIASTKAVKIAIYIVGNYLGKNDEIQVKDMFLNKAK